MNNCEEVDPQTLSHIYPSFFRAVLAAARRYIGLKVVGMTVEQLNRRKIATAEKERDELRERLGIHSQKNKAKNRVVKDLTSGQKPEIW